MHGNVAGCWAMHGNVAGCWAMHGNVAGCWAMHGNVAGCWAMHGNVAGCWAMHGNVAGCWATHVILRFQAMDGDMYSKVREAYMSVAQIQLDTWALIRADFEDLREQASLVRGVVVGGLPGLCM